MAAYYARDTNDLADAQTIRINTGVSSNDRSHSGVEPLGQSKESVPGFNRITKGANRAGGRGRYYARDTNDLADAQTIRINTGVSGNDRSHSGVEPLGQSKESVPGFNRITKGANRASGRWRYYARDTNDLADAQTIRINTGVSGNDRSHSGVEPLG